MSEKKVIDLHKLAIILNVTQEGLLNSLTHLPSSDAGREQKQLRS
jgi:hypothetical protein